MKKSHLEHRVSEIRGRDPTKANVLASGHGRLTNRPHCGARRDDDRTAEAATCPQSNGHCGSLREPTPPTLRVHSRRILVAAAKEAVRGRSRLAQNARRFLLAQTESQGSFVSVRSILLDHNEVTHIQDRAPSGL